ncbi:addiction module protein [Fimbriiglobus ruber]|uniref:Addiction module component n=1 Tax=Fimbriiglobus ruber TaxID=1908690 RepID=A0A225E3K6_9BACT|nr:addiction module protein [Fimbriiglobus ruber]OWK45378.1 hypothetical protein FRUB_01709 [Fimbriiglobus ruber]
MNHPAIDLPVDELTVDERLTLLGRLWDSLLDAGLPPVPAWHLDEVRRRMTAADSNPGASIPLEELRRERRGEQP